MNDLPIDDSMPVQPPALPPVNVSPQHPENRPPVAPWRWWVHLIMLTAYPLTIGLLGAFVRDREDSPALSDNLVGLFLTVLQTYLFFGFFFGIAWFASKAGLSDLMIRWRNGWRPWAFGLGYSFALQIVVRIVVMIVLVIAVISTFVSHGGPITQETISEHMSQLVQKFRPETEKLVDSSALVSNPLYLLATMTIVSFAMAGFTEELWRAGMLAGFRALYPSAFATIRGKVLFVFIVATVFGIGHLPQGMGAVLLTGIIGLQLGAIMLYHRSMWIAAITHGFFDATSFLTLWYVQLHPELMQQLEKLIQEKH